MAIGHGGKRQGAGRKVGSKSRVYDGATASAVRTAALEASPAALERLVELMRSKNERVALNACMAILDRGCGKPPVEVTGPDGGAMEVVVTLGGDADKN